ncbi:DUF881 domain-containing protein [Luteococcus sp. H138]|uniref:DUF881 domain-containing protein n=1 Tax=unclassified Luteococcus TaxID=2639923 RepID=UPI00313D643B
MTTPTVTGQPRRPDASMDLLAVIQRNAVDPDYHRAAASGRSPARPGLRAVGLGLAAALIAMAAAQTHSSLPGAQQERAELIQRVRTAESSQDALQETVALQDAEVRELQRSALPRGAEDVGLQVRSGSVPVSGPGISISIDDAEPAGHAEPARVTDQDLRRLVNGLWQAGAESISINDHRITSRTAIRSAGSAITVDYRSLQHPYRVEAIGDPRSLGSALANTPGGQWWSFLKDNYGLRYRVSTAERLTLPADPGLAVELARVER